ncbi:hypothetical protein BRARA_G00946 [Brassica rapa]|uniref:Major facilitator superfamily (MFS) profile domain-containing protein n=1 Tax=Brassica campestris TaxID=3711 RepID=A0A397YJI0_BRACM|nr:hypothetical protein BRARA_G00946 [Brassica rapa]
MEVLENAKNPNNSPERKRGGWISISFILGNETLERMGTIGLSANFMAYLTNVFHMKLVDASNVFNLWLGLSNLAPLLGAIISDAYAGRFKTIAYASFFSLLGLMTVTLTAWLHQLHPPECNIHRPDSCDRPNKLQLGVLFLGLSFLSIGSGGIRPCSIPFGVDQFDQRTEKGLKGMASYFNWYYLTFSIVLIVSHTVIKRNLKLPVEDDGTVEYYDPPLKPGVLSKLPLTNQYKFLDKAAVITEDDLTSAGVPVNKWRLCSVQEVEEVKCLIRIIPVWSAGIISVVTMSTQVTFIVPQAMKMDRHMGPHFEIPAGSVSVISFITIGIWLPIYDRVIVPSLWRIRKFRVTLLQRMGIGIVFGIVSMFTAAIVERVRRTQALKMTQMSVFWLAWQLVLMGLSESFNYIGQIEFFNSQFPEHMRSLANSLFPLSFAASHYLTSLLVTTVHKFSGGKDKPDWLDNDLNKGRLDYLYYMIAGLGVVNLVYFWYCARSYQYKAGSQIEDLAEEKSLVD